MQNLPLFEATHYFRPFPDPSDVFGSEVDLHTGYLLPLASIDLSHVMPKAGGIIHFIQPIEPEDGIVGEGGEKHFNHLCRENWVGYRYDGNKCQLATHFEFFQLAALRAEQTPTGKKKRQIESLSNYYAKVRSGYELRKSHFREHGALHSAWAEKRKGVYSDDDRIELVNILGGLSHSGNWSELGDFPLAHSTVADSDGEEWSVAVPKTEDGRDFVFIGRLSSYHYIAENADLSSLLACDLLLFYDPASKVALTTFDW